MKVAFLSFDFGEYSVRLASALTAMEQGTDEVEVLLLLPKPYLMNNKNELHPAVVPYAFHKPRIREPFKQLRLMWDLHQAIRRFEPDVVHYQHRHPWFNLSLALLKRYPLVITIHDPREHGGDNASQRVPQVVSDFGYHSADQIIVHAEHLKRVTMEALSIPAERIHVVPMVAVGKENEKDVPEDESSVLFFGRIWAYKGLEYLIRAEPLIAEQVPEARIVIAGEGEDFARYRRMMHHPERFDVYNEYVSDEKRGELFQRAAVVVLPYVEATQSGVVSVAYTFAKPVVATAVGGLPELVEHERTGYIVPPRDERALADALVHLLRDRDLRHRMGRNGRQLLETKFSPEAVARGTFEVYKRAVEQRQAPENRPASAVSKTQS